MVIDMKMRLPLNQVQAGMKLAQPLYRNFLILMHAQQRLTERHLERLRHWHFDSIVVEL
jgi:hypothetical protein